MTDERQRRENDYCERCGSGLSSSENGVTSGARVWPCSICMREARADGHRTGWNDAVKFYGLNQEDGA